VEIIGGLDVCKELVAKGEFLPLIPKSSITAKVEDKFNQLLDLYPVLVLTDGFSFESKET
jgi:hypothetical protein